MNTGRTRWLAGFAVLLAASIACMSIPSIPSIPTFPPKPGTDNVPTGSSPMSGDWNADTEFGHLAFTVDPDGNNVVTTLIKMDSFTYGGTFLLTETQILNSWPIQDNEFYGSYALDDGHFQTMSMSGRYDAERNTFAGTWEEDASGAICSGEWEAIPRN